MIRFLFRLLGFLVLAAGFVMLVIDGTRSIASGALVLTPTEQSWAAASPGTLAKTKALVADTGIAALSDPALSAILAAPAFVPLVVLGVALMLIGRRPRRKVGVVP